MPQKERMIKYYDDLFKKFGYDHRSLDWKDPVGQKKRYSVLFDAVRLGGKEAGFSLLDLGSGLGHFYGYLKESGALKKHKIGYTGCDINPDLVSAAKKKFPEARFETIDILEGYFTQKFDYVFSCGVFNIRLSSVSEHDAFVKEMLLRMYESSNVAAAANFLSHSGLYHVHGRLEDESVYCYFKPEEIVQYVRSFTGKFVLRQDYHPADFTVYMLKE
jgi:SAM-dependent methyltransferase